MKLTNKHLKIFDEVVRKWADKFQLNSWEIEVYFEELEETVMAESYCDLNGYVAGIKLNTEWQEKKRNVYKDLSRVAKHEVLHILTARMRITGEQRYINEKEYNASEEELVRKLEHIL